MDQQENVGTEAGKRPIPVCEDHVLCNLAVKKRFVTERQIAEALLLQKQEKDLGNSLSLESILVSHGFITEKQLGALCKARDFLSDRQADVLFGKAVVKCGFAGQEHVDEALRQQSEIFRSSQSFKPIGNILVERGILSPKQRDALLSKLEGIRKKKTQESGFGAGGGPKDSGASVEHPGETAPQDIPDEELGADGKIIFEDACFKIVVSNDQLKAYIQVKEEPPAGMTVKDLEALIQLKGIRYGLRDEAMLSGFLKYRGLKDKFHLLAEGSPPKPGQDGEIRFFFNTESPKMEVVEEGGKANFKNREEFPFVRKGDLIGEKTPRIKEENGIDVYGRVVREKEAKNANFALGSGVELSGDALRVYAKVDGRPELSVYGRVSVLPELSIQGDVSFETGNIAFDGIVNVNGVIQDGFQVRAGSLTAREIAKADIEVEGDVIVHGGILGAGIRSKGSVSALHVYAAEIDSLGDVTVDRGIVDSKISTSGKVVVTRAKILSSRIAAKKGIEAGQIGSDRSKPCSLTVGVESDVILKELERVKDLLSEYKAKWAECEASIDGLEESRAGAERRIGELVQLQDQSEREKGVIREELEELKKLNDSAQAAQAQMALEEIDAEIGRVAADIEKLFEQSDGYKEKIASLQNALDQIGKEVGGVENEIDKINEWMESNTGFPVVQVSRTLSAGTVIKGPNASMICKSNIQGVIVKEVKTFDPITEKPTGFGITMYDMK
jgi:uncharacterized protein (DUF342 family)